MALPLLPSPIHPYLGAYRLDEAYGPHIHDLTLEEHDRFLWGLWELTRGTDHGECLALEHKTVSEPR